MFSKNHQTGPGHEVPANWADADYREGCVRHLNDVDNSVYGALNTYLLPEAGVQHDSSAWFNGLASVSPEVGYAQEDI